MQKLIALIVSAVAALAGYKSTIKDLKTENDALNAKLNEQATTIETLQQQHDEDSIDDSTLEEAAASARAAADAANARAAELQAMIDEANTAGEELAKALTDEPQAPSVDADFNVTAEAKQVSTEDGQ